jgi:hypothetical protein
MEDSKTLFCSSKFPYIRKEFLQNLQKIWAHALKKVRQPCSRPYIGHREMCSKTTHFETISQMKVLI